MADADIDYLYTTDYNIFAVMQKLFAQLIRDKTKLPLSSISTVIDLLDNGATIPFIARYRKEMTGSLDEVAIGDIKKALTDLTELEKRKTTILKAIEEQDALTPKLKAEIADCWDKTTLEDLYLPFKKKQKTKASAARDYGLEPLAKIIMGQHTQRLSHEAQRYVNKKVPSVELALEGARYIIAEWISENPKTRTIVRSTYDRQAIISSKVIKTKIKEAGKYDTYFDFSAPLKNLPSHRLLAIYRGEKEGFLRVKIAIDDSYVIDKTIAHYQRIRHGECADQIAAAVTDSFSRLILPSIENEVKKKAKAKADIEAIKVFSKNLKDLLLMAPLGAQKTMALDPGFRTGCKLVVLDHNGDLLHNNTIYPHPPHSKVDSTISLIKKLVSEYQITAIAIGNGTAGKETYRLIKNITFDSEVECYFVNESGASIYSASKLAREELPDQDITVRGAVSIGRRLMDPLAELVKIDPKSIGVGQYQHDVDQKLLKDNLDETIISCVNSVGININTASKQLLTYVSGLGPVLAQNIIDHRSTVGPFTARKELLTVKRMGKKAYEQAAGFLRIRDGVNPLDNTAVHPESYPVVKKMLKDMRTDINTLLDQPEQIADIPLQNYVTDKIGLPTLKDISGELMKPGLDPRGSAKAVAFSNSINSISDLSIGMILPGVVNNVTKFGAFVDIGIKESGLVHISQIVNKFIKDPAEVLSVNQEVTVKVIDIDLAKKRVALSMKEV